MCWLQSLPCIITPTGPHSLWVSPAEIGVIPQVVNVICISSKALSSFSIAVVVYPILGCETMVVTTFTMCLPFAITVFSCSQSICSQELPHTQYADEKVEASWPINKWGVGNWTQANCSRAWVWTTTHIFWVVPSPGPTPYWVFSVRKTLKHFSFLLAHQFNWRI